jgi:TetR/AcrR family transcriptional regulator
MARPRSPDHDAQRERILGAAARLFAERGYTGSTMNDVAAASGVSKATLYHYVRDKHDLLHQIAAGHVQRLAALVPEPRPDVAAAERLPRLIERFLRAYADSGAEHRVLTEDTRYLEPAARQAVKAAQRALVQVFADHIAALRPDLAAAPPLGHAPPVPPVALAMLLMGMMNWTFTWLRPGGELTHAALAPVIAQLFSGGLPAVHPPPSAAAPTPG